MDEVKYKFGKLSGSLDAFASKILWNIPTCVGN